MKSQFSECPFCQLQQIRRYKFLFRSKWFAPSKFPHRVKPLKSSAVIQPIRSLVFWVFVISGSRIRLSLVHKNVLKEFYHVQMSTHPLNSSRALRFSSGCFVHKYGPWLKAFTYSPLTFPPLSLYVDPCSP